ncbi:MAG TPA: 3-phosphoshikimate 1-carboxyvinyltransferase [Frankiaceae bacterium]|nr:3-phosphoshikimate 1-carboxyvinyltransferase [Frankiaceae bacterium]
MSAPVVGTVRVPGSKSATNRALILAALADGPSRLSDPLLSRDTALMAAGLKACGVGLDDAGAGRWTVSPDGGPGSADGPTDGPTDGPALVDCGNAGTVARFLPPAAAVLPVPAVRFDGDPRMRERPLGPLLTALADLGATIDDAGRGAMPFTLHAPAGLRGGEITLDASSSSQLVSGLLLAAPRSARGIVVRHVGPPIPSAPHLRMTVAMLRENGAEVDDTTPDVWSVAPGGLRAVDRAIEPDLSSASAFLAAAAATGGRVTLEGWPAATEQPGRLLPELLEAFGCRCSVEDGRFTVQGPERLRGVDLDLHEYGEATPTLCALAVLADSPSRLRGVAHLRLQETDRLAALAEEFGRLGAAVEVTADGLAVSPAPLRGGTLDPRADHRLAMAYAVVGLVVPGVQVLDIGTTGKTVPDFPARWTALVAARPAG